MRFINTQSFSLSMHFSYQLPRKTNTNEKSPAGAILQLPIAQGLQI